MAHELLYKVPTFPQQVILADGSTFMHFTTSPVSSVQLTRDTTNNPLWNTNVAASSHGTSNSSSQETPLPFESDLPLPFIDGFEAGEEESAQFTRYRERYGGLQVTSKIVRGKGGKAKKPAPEK